MNPKSSKRFLRLFFAFYAAIGLLVVAVCTFAAIRMKEPMALIGSGIGLVFLLIGGIGLLVMDRSARNKKDLIENGYAIWATVTDVQKNTGVRVNGRFADKLVCQGTDLDGNPCVYTSENLFTDEVYLARGQSVQVFLSREKPGKYYVDVRAFTHEEF